ncbi:hypothetical protein ACQPW3_10085 [Actinosynnema sp. CA-248983]
MNVSTCMVGVPAGTSSSHGHWMLPNRSSRSNDTPANVGVSAAISAMISRGWPYSMG